LSGEDEVVLPAVETPAEDRATIIDRASGSAEIDAVTVLVGGEERHGIPRRPVRHDAMPV
jgi:hypothetical protein